jgi:hypothetical protein
MKSKGLEASPIEKERASDFVRRTPGGRAPAFHFSPITFHSSPLLDSSSYLYAQPIFLSPPHDPAAH